MSLIPETDSWGPFIGAINKSCLLLLTALKSPSDTALRTLILQKMHSDADIKLENVIADCITYLTTKIEANIVENPSKLVNTVWKGSNRKSGTTPKRNPVLSKPISPCHRCGKLHWIKDCEHARTVCRNCQKTGHLERVCRTRQHKRNPPSQGSKMNINSLLVPALRINSLKSNQLLEAEILVDGNPINFIIDCGSEATVVNEETLGKIDNPVIKQCSERSRLYDGTCRSFLGHGKATFVFGDHSIITDFYLAKRGSLNLLGTNVLKPFGFMDSPAIFRD